jgi:5'(3')-deoxyribonucleotidase
MNKSSTHHKSLEKKNTRISFCFVLSGKKSIQLKSHIKKKFKKINNILVEQQMLNNLRQHPFSDEVLEI